MLTFILMISFASVNAVLFTPALPDIATFFQVSDEAAQLTLLYYLVAYALGQLLYGPLACRFGRKNALYIGIGMQIVASLACAWSGAMHSFYLLVLSRFLVALGAGVGLKMTFTLINETYEPKQASQKISYLMLAFAITPGLSVALGGFLNENLGWMSCFLAGSMYGVLLLSLVRRLNIQGEQRDKDALRWSHLRKAYATQFNNPQLLFGGLLMGSSSAFIYAFAALAPFVAINSMGMNTVTYGMANTIPSIGLIVGSFASAHYVKRYTLHGLIKIGILISMMGAALMGAAIVCSANAIITLFIPMLIINLGLSFILPNASTLAMSYVNDKAHGAAVMSFINMAFATVVVLALGWLPISTLLLPALYLGLGLAMVLIYALTRHQKYQIN